MNYYNDIVTYPANVILQLIYITNYVMRYMILCTYSYAFLTVVAIPTKPHPNAQNSSYNTHAKLQLLKEVCGIS